MSELGGLLKVIWSSALILQMEELRAQREAAPAHTAHQPGQSQKLCELLANGHEFKSSYVTRVLCDC